jgi:hypothetical protein
METSIGFSVRQVGSMVMVLMSSLKQPVRTITQRQEERVMEEETIEDRLTISLSIALKPEGYI